MAQEEFMALLPTGVADDTSKYAQSNGNSANQANGTNGHGKRPHPGDSPVPSRLKNRKLKPPKKRYKGRKVKHFTEGTAEEVLIADIQSLLATMKLEVENKPQDAGVNGHVANMDATNGNGVLSVEGDRSVEVTPATEPEEELPEQGTEVHLEVIDLSSTGEALAVLHKEGENSESSPKSNHIYVLSYAVPGDIVCAKVYRHLPASPDASIPPYSVADYIKVVRHSPIRDDSRIRCQYFSRCAGCQYQMLDYAEQLRIKRRVVERAYRHFSLLPPEKVPTILETVASPLQYGYRTKLTPHFDGPPGFRRRNKEGHKLQEVPDVGFTAKGGGPRTIIDIEQCPIGTPAVGAGMTRERARIAQEYGTYSKGATILLRESTKRYPKKRIGSRADDKEGAASVEEEQPPSAEDTPADAVRVETDDYVDIKTCMTDNKATTTEYVDEYIFTNPAGSFFQNNNSILKTLTSYVRNAVLPNNEGTSRGDLISSVSTKTNKPLRYLIDAYSGSGLFTITLASTLPGGSIGIDIADASIAYARTNAQLNNLAPDRCRFIAADAAQLFASVIEYDADETVVVLDPPRKGCDALFLRQLLAYGPARIVYVSCNVHTQARDVGMLVRGQVDGFGVHNREREGAEPVKRARYEIESLRGFDFFPQTAHVEGIAVLNRVEEE